MRNRLILTVAVVVTTALVGHSQIRELPVRERLDPWAQLERTDELRLPGEVDSNSPALWERIRGRSFLFVMTSVAGVSSVSGGPDLSRQAPPREMAFDPPVAGGAWMEAVVSDVDGTWYGYYHNEVVPAECPGTTKVLPRIGAAVSRNLGRTWINLGNVLEAPPSSQTCVTPNVYFVGGVGDLSAVLDGNYVYLFYSQYGRDVGSQGVSVARLAWADRDEPVGRVDVWQDGVWLPPGQTGTLDAAGEPAPEPIWTYPAGTPIYRAQGSWHQRGVDAYWGPSVHWNSYLERYVMLLNHATDSAWNQEGIYIAFAGTLEDPLAWSAPRKLLTGGRWYPQVVGLEPKDGTDKNAGETARFFMSGESDYIIRFLRP